MKVTTPFSGKRRSARSKKCVSTSGLSCIRPCIGTPRLDVSDHPVSRGGVVGLQRSERICPLDGETTSPARPEREPRRGPLALLIAPIVVMIAAGYVADALWPTLVE